MAQAIVKCSCKSEYQDKQYGVGMRLCNCKNKEKKGNECTCTVCGKNHQYKSHELTK